MKPNAKSVEISRILEEVENLGLKYHLNSRNLPFGSQVVSKQFQIKFKAHGLSILSLCLVLCTIVHQSANR